MWLPVQSAFSEVVTQRPPNLRPNGPSQPCYNEIVRGRDYKTAIEIATKRMLHTVNSVQSWLRPPCWIIPGRETNPLVLCRHSPISMVYMSTWKQMENRLEMDRAGLKLSAAMVDLIALSPEYCCNAPKGCKFCCLNKGRSFHA